MRCLWWTILVVAAVSGSPTFEKLKSIYSWKALEFAFPSESARQIAIQSGNYIPGAPLPIDVDVYNGGKHSRVFVAIPRIQNGVPVTLGYVTDQVSPNGDPIIEPYPNWSYNTLGSCDSISSVFRMQIDQCGRLWVLDTGKQGEQLICQPQLHVFNLHTSKLITRYKFPKDQFKENSLFVTVVVDVRDADRGCKDTYAYIADVTGFALLVFDYRHSRSWKIYNNLFYPYPPYGTFYIKGDTFDLMDGILGLALGPVQNGDRMLYFHSLASRVESRVLTSVIRNYTLFHENAEAAARSFVPFEQQRSSQSAAEAMDRNGVLFFGLLSDLAIGCWNSKHYPQYGDPNNEILITNPDTLQFPSGLKIITSKEGVQELWILSMSFQKYMTGSLNSNETNFRIQAGYVHELVRGTNCDVTSLSVTNGGCKNFRDMCISWLLAFCFGVISLENTVLAAPLTVIKEWNYIDFLWPNSSLKQQAIETGNYVSKNIIPIDVEIMRLGDKIFVTTIRDKGVPASLSIVTSKMGEGGPLLAPYPNWDYAKTDTCNGIISTYRVAIDRCNKLWVLDTGIIGEEVVCPPKLLVFDLSNDRLVKTIEIPKDVATNSTSGMGLLVTPIVKNFGLRCEIVNVYIADVMGYAIVVYNGKTFRRVTSAELVFDPKAVNYTIEGQSFQLEDGVVGMDVSDRTNKLYFSPMSSYNMGYTRTYALSNYNNNNVPFQVAHDILPTQSSAKAMSATGILFYGLVGNTAIGCWNERMPLTKNYMGIVAQNSTTLQFTSGMKIKGNTMWVMTNRFQKGATGTLNISEVNFRILKGNIDDLVRDTVCQMPFLFG
ncbi:PREDICTED: uncharacterized protein LOC107186448 [Dufourea novaeangliae]|uniref:uncharacterized protein LOC107186448 n=1 Tax=Dufourea novaeangliae TaxID=178035 RepID=UPI00076728C0|nr:PREDICTED: uncharacterized protein LOC107186448 [Dufourea novaeangliae]